MPIPPGGPEHPRGLGADLSPEAGLLLACARLEIRPEALRRVQGSDGPPLDWPRLMALAKHHGLRPLLSRHLRSLELAQLPRQIFVDLWARQEWLAHRNRAMAEALREVLDLLEGKGIPALPYKGPALAMAVYGDLALREFGDLDILLRPKDLLAAKEALKAIGFEPEYDLTPAAEAAFLRASAQYHLVMHHRERDLLVELHWKTDPDHPVELDTDAWWEAMPRSAFQGGWIRGFANHELLLVLCLHGSKHHWSSLGWLVDVAELIQGHPGMDWDWILARGETLSGMRRLALGLHLAHHLLDAPLPPAVLQAIAKDPRVASLAARITAALFEPEPRAPGPVRRLRMDLALTESPRRKLRLLLGALVAPSLVEWGRWPLPRSLSFLYPLLRLSRLFGKHVLRIRERR